MIFEVSFEPLFEEYSPDRYLSIQGILKLLENSGNKHSDFVGDGIFDGLDRGIAWFLTDWRVEVAEYRNTVKK